MSINSVTLSGNLTRDFEVRTTASGTPVGSVGIAVNDRRKNGQTGEWEDHANFFDLVMYGSRSEKIAQYLTKGTHVTVSGKLQHRQWEKDGQRRSKVEVVIDDIDFTGRRAETHEPVKETEAYYDENIPF